MWFMLSTFFFTHTSVFRLVFIQLVLRVQAGYTTGNTDKTQQQQHPAQKASQHTAACRIKSECETQGV